MIAFLVTISLAILLVVGGTLISGRIGYVPLSFAVAGSYPTHAHISITRSEISIYARRALLVLIILIVILSTIFISVTHAITQ
jgi:hypothetical protein